VPEFPPTWPRQFPHCLDTLSFTIGCNAIGYLSGHTRIDKIGGTHLDSGCSSQQKLHRILSGHDASQPMTGMVTALAVCQTMRKATGFTTGTDKPPVIVESFGRLVSASRPFPTRY
jgi:hypothetical protein